VNWSTAHGYAVRHAGGNFNESDDVGRSLTAERRKTAKPNVETDNDAADQEVFLFLKRSASDPPS
jgi:hypothetical protein